MEDSNTLDALLKERGLRVTTASGIDDFLSRADKITLPVWPEFMLNDEYSHRYWAEMCRLASDFQFVLVDDSSGEWLAVGNSIPVFWDLPLGELPDKGWDWALQNGVEGLKSGFRPNYLSAIAIQIKKEYQGKGLSSLMVRAMRQIAMNAGLQALIAPVRPNRKSDYPLLDMEDYISWTRDEYPFDPWLRVHAKLGAQILKVCPQAMLIKGAISDWHEWTGLSFQTSGQYIIPGALVPVEIDLEEDLGTYIEPNVWMVHQIN